MNYKQLNLKVDNELFYQLTAYAEQERRTINNATQYIIQRFFKEHPVDYMEVLDGRR